MHFITKYYVNPNCYNIYSIFQTEKQRSYGKDKIEGIRKNDKLNDYTNDWTNEQIYKHFYDIEEKDKNNYEFCKKNNIKYYDTYENRKELFEQIIEDINNM